jgi:hypothetical protein
MSQHCNCKKKLCEGLDLMVVYPWNFEQVERKPWKIIFSLKFSIFFQVVKFISNVLRTFVSTLSHNNEWKLWFF